MTRPARLHFEHVAFDLDGTLLDSRADLAAATNHVLRSFGLHEIPPRSVFALVGEGARRLVERALGPERADDVDEGVRRFLAYYGAHLLDASDLYPGVPQMLDMLIEARVTLSILSNKPEGMSRTILEGLHLTAYFQTVIGGDTLPTRKPDPGPLLHAAALLGVPVDRLLMIGDSVNDVLAARAAGSPVLVVPYGYNEGEPVQSLDADGIVPSLAAVVDRIRYVSSDPR